MLKPCALAVLLVLVACTISGKPAGVPTAGASDAVHELTLWSANMGSEGWERPETEEARRDHGRRQALLAAIMRVQSGNGFAPRLVALQESSVGGDHRIHCENGERVPAGQCLAMMLKEVSGRSYESVSDRYLAIVYDTTMFRRAGGPFSADNTTPGYEGLVRGRFLGLRVTHLASGQTFMVVSLHLAPGNPEPFYQQNLWLLEKFIRAHRQPRDAMALAAGDYNWKGARSTMQHPFIVVKPPPPEDGEINLLLAGPRDVPAGAAFTPMPVRVAYFMNQDGGSPDGNPCDHHLDVLWNTEHDDGLPWEERVALSDHCTMAVQLRLQPVHSPPPCDTSSEAVQACVADCVPGCTEAGNPPMQCRRSCTQLCCPG